MILDGYGLNDKCEHNAVCEAKTPIMDQLMSQCPYVKGQASEMCIRDRCDVFVNDAFGTAHRAHCSNVGVTKYVDTAVVGYLMEKRCV